MNWIRLLWAQISRYSFIPSRIFWQFKAYWFTVRLRGKTVRPCVGISNRESHGQTVRVGRSGEGLVKSTFKVHVVQPIYSSRQGKPKTRFSLQPACRCKRRPTVNRKQLCMNLNIYSTGPSICSYPWTFDKHLKSVTMRCCEKTRRSIRKNITQLGLGKTQLKLPYKLSKPWKPSKLKWTEVWTPWSSWSVLDRATYAHARNLILLHRKPSSNTAFVSKLILDQQQGS